jgi:hypothetical protein
MVHQYYFQQKVMVKRGNDKICGSITDFNEDKKEYLVKSDCGYTFYSKEKNIEPDYSRTNYYTQRNFN